MSVTITLEHPDTLEIIEVIDELTAILSAPYPPESVHGYSVQQLIDQRVAFHVIRVNGEIAGCGGVQFIKQHRGPRYGELKRMYVRPAFQRRGLARQLLIGLEDYTKSHAINLLRLETGIYSEAAIALYQQHGFYEIAPFGDYVADPNSRFFEKKI